MPFNPLSDAVAPDPPRRVAVTDDQGQLLDGGVRTYVWDVPSLAWVRATQASVTISSLAVTVGSVNGLMTVLNGSLNGLFSVSGFPTVNIGFAPTLVIGLMPAITIGSTNGIVSISGIPTVVVGSMPSINGTVAVAGTVPVSGTFWQATQPVSGTVAVSTMPSVNVGFVPSLNGIFSLSGMPTVNVGNVAAVSQSGAWTSTSTVNIGSALPAFAAVPTVWVGSIPTVSVGNVPAVTVTSGSLNSTILHGKTIKTAAVSLNGTGVVVAGVAGKVLKVFSARVIASASTAVKFQDNDTDIEGSQQLTGAGGFVETTFPPAFLFKTTASLPLKLSIIPSVLVGGRVSYWDDDAS